MSDTINKFVEFSDRLAKVLDHNTQQLKDAGHAENLPAYYLRQVKSVSSYLKALSEEFEEWVGEERRKVTK